MRILSLLLLFSACGPSDESTDASLDAGATDAGSDSSTDVGPADVSELDAPVLDVPEVDAGPITCGGESGAAMARCVEQARYNDDLVFIAQPRSLGTPHWMAVQDLCAERFAAAGFDVERHEFSTGVNVIGTKLGTSIPDRRVIIAAHYDGTPGCDGADDNATGVAGVLEAARVLGQYEHERTLVVACWDDEEGGLRGSSAYATRESEAKRGFDINFNFEMIGYVSSEPGSQQLPEGFDILFEEETARIEANMRRGDFIAWIGDFASAPFVERLAHHADSLMLRHEPLTIFEGFHLSPLLSDLRRSDHDSFWQTEVPAIMITDTSEFRYSGYHCRGGEEDTVDRLDIGFATLVTAATVGAAADALSAE